VGTVTYLHAIQKFSSVLHIQSLYFELNSSIQRHTQALALWTYEHLSVLRHSNGQPITQIFGKHHLPDCLEVCLD
jgi:hypothetical protein